MEFSLTLPTKPPTGSTVQVTAAELEQADIKLVRTYPARPPTSLLLQNT